jgi:hypothetical protein
MTSAKSKHQPVVMFPSNPIRLYDLPKPHFMWLKNAYGSYDNTRAEQYIDRLARVFRQV